MAKKKKETKAPDGISFARNGEKLAVKWKIKDSDYKDGQQFKYRTHKASGKGWHKWHSVSVGKTTTSTAITIERDSFYPHNKKPVLPSIQVAIRGKRKEDSKHVYTWSDWTKKVYSLAIPVKPTISASLKDTHTGCNFAWSVDPTLTKKSMYTRVRIETKLKGQDENWSLVNTYTGTSGTYSKDEDTSVIGTGSHTRRVRIRAEGPRGTSDWKEAKYVYALPYQAQVTKASYSIDEDTQGVMVNVEWKTKINDSHPVDRTTVEYAIIVPDENLECPSGAGWNEGNVSKDIVDKKSEYATSKARFSIDDVIGQDQCLYVRVNTHHGFDGNTTYGDIVRAGVGKLKDPEIDSLQDTGGDSITITATNNSEVPDSRLVIVYAKKSAPDIVTPVGTLPHAGGTAIVKIPDRDGEAVILGVYAMVGNIVETDLGDGYKSYAITSKMKSENTVWDGGDVPQAPTGVAAVQTEISGTIRVTWNWDWELADSAILSWSDHADAWESTDEPEEYTVSQMYASAWNISGLETGKTWYVRVRLTKGLDDNITYSPWSKIVSVDLTSAPNVPSITLSRDVITEDGTVTARWAFVSTDGTGQSVARICEATLDNNGLNYGTYQLSEDTSVVEGKTYYTLSGEVYTAVASPTGNPSENEYYEIKETPVATTQTAQSVDISAEVAGWSAGETHLLCLQVTSASNVDSKWSEPVSITIADPVSVEITQTSLQALTITDGVDEEEQPITRQVASLTVMPLTVTVTGAGVGGTTTLAIERAEDYHLARPDESDFNGFEGETVYLYSQTGESQIEINSDALIGALDDEASYRIVATVEDQYGQTASTSILPVQADSIDTFEVHWTHQAVMPEASVEIDSENMVAKITPGVPEDVPAGWELATGDTFDIYRLSADRPELIVENGTWGTTYVDPYPALGENGGHRIVFKTVNGDYITEENIPSWIDLTEDDDDILDLEDVKSIIDFGGNQILLSRNVDLGNEWSKDFQETKYLGGSVQGDWNTAVSRTASVSTTTLPLIDADIIAQMRRLATYAGVCHIRTFDGTSMECDIQVSEDRDHESYGQVVNFSLSVTRVDPEGFEGLTLEQWQEGQAE